MNTPTTLDSIFIEIKEDIIKNYGVIIGGKNLYKVLGYPSSNAFRQAVNRETVPVKLIEIDNRRGKFSFANDIAYWLANEKFQSENKG